MDNNIKITKSVLEKGWSIGEHTHKTSSEIIYIISGTAKCTLNGYIRENVIIAQKIALILL